MTEPRPPMLTRREFVERAAAASAAAMVPVPLLRRDAAPLKVGLVGCGGRGSGAALDCLRSSDGVELVAMGDLFADRLAGARDNFAKLKSEEPATWAKMRVDDARCFTGFDAYRRVLDSGIDLVILATPPAFRPAHLAAAVAAGKHVFMEKPVAVDPTGVRAVIAAAAAAERQHTAIVAGTQRRHDAGYRAAMERLHGGAIGRITGGQVFWNQGGLWNKAREAGWSDAEWQIRNWLYFTWLSGDHICEQHIHNLDVANWAMDAHPIRAVGVGGRQWRIDPAYGHIYDHFAVDFEYPDNRHVLSMCRQIDGTAPFVGERFQGATGTSDGHAAITGEAPWTFAGERRNPYVQEHADLIASIRSGTPLNEGKRVAESTLTAIMGREAAYTGQVIEWDALLAAPLDLMPPDLQFGPLPVPPVAMPDQTTLTRAWNG